MRNAKRIHQSEFPLVVGIVLVFVFLGIMIASMNGCSLDPAVDPGASAKAITSFEFESPKARGIISEVDRRIVITVPYGTTETRFSPVIQHSGASVYPASGAQQDFWEPVDYTVTARDGSTRSYTVELVVANVSSKMITSFTIASPAATGVIDEATHTISINYPYGTDVTALVPSITHTGESIRPASEVARDFRYPAEYTVRAADGSIQKYRVVVTVAPLPKITAFSFDAFGVNGTIDQTARTITLLIPGGTDITALVPTITHTGASLSPASGEACDFTQPVDYAVTDSFGVSQTYTVTVNRPPSITTTPIAAVTLPGNIGLSASIGGTVALAGGTVTDDGLCATERGICWNATGNPGLADTVLVDATGGLGAFTVSLAGLTPHTRYYARAYAKNQYGTVYGEVVSFDSGYPFGTEHEGGYVFYNDGTGHGMVAGKVDLTDMLRWAPIESYDYLGTKTAIGYGQSNTTIILTAFGEYLTAAKACNLYDDGTYTDWFLPSYDELRAIYSNVYKLGYGTFFLDSLYWSSSELAPPGSAYAYCVDFAARPENYYDYSKDLTLRVRPARAF